jgi:hypothetical protein
MRGLIEAPPEGVVAAARTTGRDGVLASLRACIVDSWARFAP